DVDGNRYLDWVLAWGPLVFGHADPETVDAVREAALDGTSFGASTEREVELAEEIVDAVPSVEQVRLVSSGTAAAMSALRLARAVTRRSRVIKFAGCYDGHGGFLLAVAVAGSATAGTVYQAGTLSGNPLATAAGLSVLRRLRDPSVYDELERRAALLEAGLAPFGLVQRVGAMLTFFPGSDALTVVTKFEQLDAGRYAEVFRGLLERDIYFAPSQYECLFPSLAHG